MSSLHKGLAWIGDMVRIHTIDRFDSDTRFFSQQASTASRSLKFHAHAKIRPTQLKELTSRLTGERLDTVLLPGPDTDFGDVGSQTGYHALGTLVKALRPKTILEFGTYLGVSAYTFALNAGSDCRIFTVDLPDEAKSEGVPDLNAIDQRHIERSRHRVGEAFLDSVFRDRIVQIRADSMNFVAEDHVPSADFVYIDGGHSLPVINADTENAFRILSSQGTIVWDDYFHLYPDVVEYLDEMADEFPLYGIAGTNYVVYSRRLTPSGKHSQLTSRFGA